MGILGLKGLIDIGIPLTLAINKANNKNKVLKKFCNNNN